MLNYKQVEHHEQPDGSNNKWQIFRYCTNRNIPTRQFFPVMPSQIQLATEIMGTKVKTKSGDPIGEIENLMIDSTKGKLVYIVLCYDGFLGERFRYFAVPKAVLKPATDNSKQYVLEVEKEELKHAQGFNPERWSLTPCQEEVGTIYELYGYEPKDHQNIERLSSEH